MALGWGVARSLAVDVLMLADQRRRVERAADGGGRTLGLVGFRSQLPRVDDQAPYYRFRRRVCEQLAGFDFVALQPRYVAGSVGGRFLADLESGALGFRRVDVPRVTVPVWLFDPEPAATNLAWINLETWLYRRDPSLACVQGPRQPPTPRPRRDPRRRR